MNPIRFWISYFDRHSSGLMTTMGLIMLFTIPTMPLLEQPAWRYYAHFIVGLFCLWAGTWEYHRRKLTV